MPNIRSEKKKKKFQNGPKSFLSRTKLRGSVGNAKQSIFYFRPDVDLVNDNEYTKFTQFVNSFSSY